MSHNIDISQQVPLPQRPKNNGPHICEVLDNIKLSNDMYALVLRNETIAQNAQPGQFVSVLCEDMLIRRPFSVAFVKNDEFGIIYKRRGKGTQQLSGLKRGDFADLLGALGNGFKIENEAENKKSLLAGCGVGIAPMIFLASRLKDLGIEHKLLVCSQTELALQEKLKEYFCFDESAIFITEDGSKGLKGRLDNHFEAILNDYFSEKIYTCGPNPAMAYISKIAQSQNLPVEAAMEREFACGTGVCMGCVIAVKENAGIVNKRICKDGPVFDAADILW